MIRKIAENFLYHIWDEQHLEKELITQDEKILKILFQGKWNTQAGPDFKDAIILLDQRKLQGDVEIHRIESDWYHHDHHEDENYNNVILHVVFEQNNSNKYTISESGNKIPILILKNNMDERIEKLWKKYGDTPFDKSQQDTIVCKLAQANLPFSKLIEIFYSEGDKRFRKKTKRFSAELYNSDFNQIVYKGILEALGYSKNKNPFLTLSSFLTYKKFQKYYSFCSSPTDVFCILAILGQIHIIDYNFKFITRSVLKKYNKMKNFIQTKEENLSKQKYNWNFFRIRPTNHPLSRMWQISPFLYTTLEENIINKIMSIFSITQEKEIKANNFKNLFYDLINQSDDLKQKIGKSRCDDIFANIILPVAFVYAKTLNYTHLLKIISKIYKENAKLSQNYITRFVHTRLKNKLKDSRKIKLIHQQGMIQHYYSFCAHFDCDNCINFCLNDDD